ncbi:hypothetical protein C5167_007503 [Papaver somniferum]|nr:hypothetical protein C5167_007503 [Papaver somniferum]
MFLCYEIFYLGNILLLTIFLCSALLSLNVFNLNMLAGTINYFSYYDDGIVWWLCLGGILFTFTWNNRGLSLVMKRAYLIISIWSIFNYPL